MRGQIDQRDRIRRLIDYESPHWDVFQENDLVFGIGILHRVGTPLHVPLHVEEGGLFRFAPPESGNLVLPRRSIEKPNEVTVEISCFAHPDDRRARADCESDCLEFDHQFTSV